MTKVHRQKRSVDTTLQAARQATKREDWQQALTLWREVTTLSGDSVESLGNTALALKALGQLDESVAHWKKALELSPKNTGLLGNLAEVYRLQQKMADAEKATRRALEIQPHRHEIRGGLATTLWDQRKIGEAFEQCALIPEDAECFPSVENLRGNMYSLLGDGAAARQAYKRALERQPDNPLYHSNYLLSLLYDEAIDRSAVFQAHEAYGKRYDTGSRPKIQNPDPTRRLRVAFVSSDFRLHSVAYFIEPLIEAMDRKRFEVILYANVSRFDDMTAALSQHAAAFVSVVGFSPDQLKAQCKADQIDILIDLNGHTGSNLLTHFATRLAPIQLSWLGYPSTTGLRSIDYRLTDALIEPPETAQAYSTEKLWPIDQGCHLYRMPGQQPALNPLPLLGKGHVTFISCNNSAKISPTTLRLWARLLREVPEARLILKNSGFVHPPRQAEIIAFFESEGVEPSRIDFYQLTSSIRKHIELYGEADIALDTYPYNGTTTTCEALWMGLPVISMKGETPASRHTASLLTQVDLGEWVVESEDAYIARVKQALSCPDELATLRASLRERMRLSPLGHSVHFAGRFQAALRRIWAQECSAYGVDQAMLAAAHASAQDDLLLGQAALAVSKAQAFEQAGRHSDAAVEWVQAARSGRVVEACAKAAQCLARVGDAARLLAFWREMTEVYPKKPEFWATLAELSVEHGSLASAVTAYEKALELSPKNPGVWMNLSAVLRSLHLSTQAEQAARKALALKPDFPEAWNNLGAALRDQADFDGAVAAFCEALKYSPQNTNVHANLLYLLNFIPGFSHQLLREQMATFNATQFASIKEETVHTPLEDKRARRVGILSSDLRRHSAGYFLRAALPALKAQAVELIIFADVSKPDDFSNELRGSADRWIWTSKLSDEDLARQIRSHELDVLIELNGCTAGHRLPMLAQRVARRQASWLGFPQAMECSGIDFFVSDKVIYAEALPALRRMEQAAFPYALPHELPPVNFDGGDAPLTFGAFHNFTKLNTGVWENWIQILKHFPTSRLLVKSKQLKDPALLARLQANLLEQGAPVERIEFLPYTRELAEHLACYRRVDFALDPSPYNGVTTTMEALSMGVPVLTLGGETPASRHAASLIKTYARGEGIFSDRPAMIAYLENQARDLDRFRLGRHARHTSFAAQLKAYAPVWAEEFLKVIFE